MIFNIQKIYNIPTLNTKGILNKNNNEEYCVSFIDYVKICKDMETNLKALFSCPIAKQKIINYLNLNIDPTTINCFELNEIYKRHNLIEFEKFNIRMLIYSNNFDIVKEGFKSRITTSNGSVAIILNQYDIKKNINKDLKGLKYDFMFFEISEENLLFKILLTIMNELKIEGNVLFKLNMDIFKQSVVYLYLLSYLFDEVIIQTLECGKNFEMYIVCKSLSLLTRKQKQYNELHKYVKSIHEETLTTFALFVNNISMHFLTKFQSLCNNLIQQTIEKNHNISSYIHKNVFYNKLSSSKILNKLEILRNKKINYYIQKGSYY